MFALNQPQHKKIANSLVFDNVIADAMCDEIIALKDSIEAEPGMQASAPEKRICDIRWIPWSLDEGINALYRNLAGAVEHANNRFWKFHLGGFLEPLQLTYYKESGHYAWHADHAAKGITMNRKISGTLLLNDEYEGGEFEFFDSPPLVGMKKGSLVLFPSYQVHRVAPITSGERWSLVFWVTGPPFV